MKIIFWQNIQSSHQVASLRALADREDCEVILVAQEEMLKWRQDMGWSVPEFGDVKLVVSPDSSEIAYIIEETGPDSIHIFGGIHAYPMVKEAFLMCIRTKAVVGLMSEAGNWRGLKGQARLLRGRLDAFRYQSRISFILAIGHLGIKWFRMCGYPEDKIFPWIYTVEKPSWQENYTNSRRKYNITTVDLTFIGRLIKLKGIDILLKALSGLKHLDWNLKIVGDGQERRNLENLSNNLGLSERVDFLGALKNEDAVNLLVKNDLFILPSIRMEGWGAVVNEALMRGVPVVCSNFCGAADLLKDPERGEVFPAGSVSALREVLSRRISQGKLTPEKAMRIKKWSRAIEGETTATYLLEVIEAAEGLCPKPAAPWLENTHG